MSQIANQNAVSIIVSRRVQPEKIAEFEETLKAVNQAITEFKGYLGTNIFYPEKSSSEYRIQIRFDSHENCQHWESSAEKEYWVAELDKYNQTPAKRHYITGLETWFALPTCQSLVPPPRYKMAIVTWLAITPSLYLFSLATLPWLGDLPLLGRMMITTMAMVSLMTYAIMPMMTKLFHKWLYK